MSKYLPPVAPPWPLPLIEAHDQFLRLRERYRDVLDAGKDGAEERLAALVDNVCAQEPDVNVTALLFDHGGRVGISVRSEGYHAQAVSRPIQGFDDVELAAIVADYRTKRRPR